MEIKTGTLGPSWNDFEAARMKREDEGVMRRLTEYQRRRLSESLTLEDLIEENY